MTAGSRQGSRHGSRQDLRKGWCPGALRPMMAGDGLLVRLRLTGGVLSAARAHALADLAGRHGNGLFDLSSRANLQMRGVREAAWPALLASLRELGLLDADAAGEAVRNVMASPLAGLGRGPDIRPLVVALERRLAGDASLHALPQKFGILVDDGGAPTLAAVPADLRFDWTGDGFAVGLGGTRAGAVPAGACDAAGLVARAAAIARAVIAAQDGGPPRRLRALLRDMDAGERAARFGVVERGRGHAARAADTVVGRQRFGAVAALGLAAPFGRLDAAMLRGAAALAAEAGGDLRLTPWRTILVPLRCGDAATVPGFITDPADPRLAVAACTGRDGCARGTTATRADAAALAPLAARQGIALHVSGCAKGCAHPAPAAVTLVGRDGGYDLVRDGTAGDAPVLTGLDLAAARAAMAAA